MRFVRAWRDGYVEGRNVAIEFRWAEGRNRSAAGAGGRTGSARDASLSHRRHRHGPLREGCHATIPIVFATGDDPVQVGLVASLNRPGGNLTGISLFGEGLGRSGSDCCMKCCPPLPRRASWSTGKKPDDRDEVPTTCEGRAFAWDSNPGRSALTESDLDAAFATLSNGASLGAIIAQRYVLQRPGDQIGVAGARITALACEYRANRSGPAA